MLASFSVGDNSHFVARPKISTSTEIYHAIGFILHPSTTLIKWNRFSTYDTKVYKLCFILFFSFIYKAPCVVLVAMHGNWLSLLQVCCFLANNKTHFSQQALLTLSHSPVCKLARFTVKAPPRKLCTDDKTIPFPRNLKCEQTIHCK